MTRVHKRIVVLAGDGIGPEVTRAAVAVLRDCAAQFGHEFEITESPIGGAAIDQAQPALPKKTLDACRAADAVLLGAVGGPKWDSLPLEQKPESALLGLRKQLSLFINVRPIRLRDSLRSISPLRPERARSIDFEIVRELAGGIYFGKRGTEKKNGAESAYDTECYSCGEIERVAKYAFTRAGKRNRRVTSVDKANVLATSVLWRKTVERMAGKFPGISLGHMYVDNAAMQLVLAPEQFDVIVTSNMFGDILSDGAAGLAGSIGLIPSMSVGSGPPLFEPIHGSAPTLAGKDVACPIGAILSATMMLRDAFELPKEAEWVERALDRVLALGYRTPDITERDCTTVGSSELLGRIRELMQESVQEVERYGWAV